MAVDDIDKHADKPTAEVREIDPATGTPTTGHSWDGIRELDTPMPRWWLWTLYATIVFSLGYVVLYPAIPLINSSTGGLLGWSSRGDVVTEIAAAVDAQSDYRARIANASMDEIVGDPDLFRFAAQAGRSAFAVNCIQCHGAGAAGSTGYPNLVDDDWLWGGTIADIHQTIAWGIRNETPDSRQSQMPAFGHDGILDVHQIRDVSAHVAALSGLKATSGDAAAGLTLFSENCAACHGEAGEGMPEMGAPALDDAIWLRLGSQDGIVAQVTNPRHGVMPAWEPRLGAGAVKELAAYVYSLGGAAEPERAAAR